MRNLQFVAFLLAYILSVLSASAFAGADSQRNQRDWKANEAAMSGSVVKAENVASETGALAPLGMNNATLGGGTFGYQEGVFSWRWVYYPDEDPQYEWLPCSGLNNIGVLIKTWGTVAEVDPSGEFFYVNDGRNLENWRRSHFGVRVAFDPAGYSVGDYVTVTGVVSCYRDDDTADILPLVRPRRAADIDVVRESPPLGQMEIGWDPTQYNHYQGEQKQLQILRDGLIYKVLSDVEASQFSSTSLLVTSSGQPYYGSGVAVYTVGYNHLDETPTDSYAEVTANVNQEMFGTQHTYLVRAFHSQTLLSGATPVTERFYYSGLGSPILATAIEPVKGSDVVWPLDGSDVLISRLASGQDRFEWQRKEGADQYYIKVEPVTPGAAPPWQSLAFNDSNYSIMLPMADQSFLAFLLNNPAYEWVDMRWRVYCRNTLDTSPGWVVGEQSVFTIFPTLPGP